MPAPLLLIDAFADGPFTGNPAGVVLLDAARDDGWYQAVAMEMNQAETAFVVRRDGDHDLRWFTPLAEVDLCGHATLATAHALWTHGGATDPLLRFRTRSGVLTAARHADDSITLDFPALASSDAVLPGDLAAAIGAPIRGAWRGPFDWLLELEDAAAVQSLVPDLAAIGACDARGVIVTAPGEGNVDFVSRFFAPAIGVPEDPVTGSAHCALAPFWAGRLGRSELVGRQLSGRGGTVYCAVAGGRVRLTGRAVTVVEGRILA